MEELLNGHPERIRNNLGMTKESFRYIEDLLVRKCGLAPTRYMGTTEQLGIFLYAVVTDLSMRKLAERFQRSTETIDQVLSTASTRRQYHPAYIPADAPTPDQILYNKKYAKNFKDCVGAVDGTKIPISPPVAERAAFRDGHGNLTQNVLAVCNFDMKFTDVLVGWEGSTADSTLWKEAIRCGAVQVPDGKYLLGDAGFAICDLLISPYRATRYHLQEWKRSGARPKNKEELFNLRHAQLRNVVERIFGVLKNRFKILILPRFFKMEAQMLVVQALCVLHNILVNLNEQDPEENPDGGEPDEDDEIEEQIGGNNGEGIEGYNITDREKTRAEATRDAIASVMWADYNQ
jgi:hypothetical protein